MLEELKVKKDEYDSIKKLKFEECNQYDKNLKFEYLNQKKSEIRLLIC